MPLMTHAARFTATLTAVLLTACATVPADPLTPEEAVKARAGERWQALIEGDAARAYDYYTEAYRAVTPPDVFARQAASGTIAREAEPVRAECEPGRCQVVVRLTFPSPTGGGHMLDTHRTENWLEEQGKWRYHPRR